MGYPRYSRQRCWGVRLREMGDTLSLTERHNDLSSLYGWMDNTEPTGLETGLEEVQRSRVPQGPPPCATVPPPAHRPREDPAPNVHPPHHLSVSPPVRDPSPPLCMPDIELNAASPEASSPPHTPHTCEKAKPHTVGPSLWPWLAW